jgi:hypothetical protein
MRNKTRPLYGSFIFGTDLSISALIARMQQVSERFLENRIFNSYLKTAEGKNHYGLSYEELSELFAHHQGLIHTITASSSTLEGKGVNINIRFPKENQEGNGQFVIVASTQFENEEIRDMLLGNWVEKAPIEEDPLPQEALGAFIVEEPLPDHESIDEDKPQKLFPGETPGKAFQVHKSAFYFQHGLKADELVDRIYNLFIQFMDDATFDIRILSWGGDLHLGIKVEDLRQTLQKLGGQIQKLYVLLDAQDGRQIDLILSFAPLPLQADSEVKIKSDRHAEIEHFVLKQFGLETGVAQARLLPFKLNFSFDSNDFQIERLIYLVEMIQKDHLPQALATAFISNKGGVLYHDVALDQLKDLFYLYQKNIHVLSLYISRAITGQTLNLVFEFGSQSGSMALQTGSDSQQDQLSSFIWETLHMQPFQSQPQPSMESTLGDLVNPLAIKPIFESKAADFNPQLCLLVLPGNPLPMEGMRAEIKRALEAAGLEVEESESIFGYLVMEKLWQKLNAASIVIADVSGKSAEVFYALGIAHTLGKEVILLTQGPSDIPFDFKKYPHIIYESNEAGYLNLRQELLAYLKKT